MVYPFTVGAVGDGCRGLVVPFEEADDVLHGQALGLWQEPVDEGDRGQREGSEADQNAAQADGVPNSTMT
jgi:hypothetical protein